MSFSSGVKDELARHIPEARGLMLAELSGMLLMIGKYSADSGNAVLSITLEHAPAVRKYFTLLKRTFKIGEELSVLTKTVGTKSHSYTVSISGEETVLKVLKGCRLAEELPLSGEELRPTGKRFLYDSGAKRAFLRGAFLASGSVSDPERSYHLEFVCTSEQKAEFLRELLLYFGCEAGIVQRKNVSVVYVKDSEEISDVFGIMEAVNALMELENIRIMKDMRNNVNRKVNCEAANISKTIGAAVKQIRDIEYIRDTEGLDGLPAQLREMAEVRLLHPDAPLKDLGSYMEPQVGKSGVNHRLRKLSEYADQLRGEKQ